MVAFGAVGSSFNFWGIRNANGYVTGTATALANGANSGMGRLFGVSSLGIQKAASRNVVIPGDNSIFGAIKIAAGDLSQGSLVTSVKNPIFTTSSQGTILDDFGDSEIALDGIPCPNYRQLVLVTNAPAVNEDGAQGFSVKIYFNIQADPRDNDTQDAQAHQYTHDLIASLANAFPWGQAFTLVDHGSTRALMTEPFFSLYPLCIHTLRRNTGVTTVVLDETPAAANADSVLAFNNGTAMTYAGSPASGTEYAVNTATRTVTLGAAGTAGDYLVIPYFFVPQC